MSNYGTLEHVLLEILQTVRPQPADRESRSRVIDELQRVIQSVQSLRGARVEPFGSFASDLFTRWGDLDISIDLPGRSYGSLTGESQKQRLLKDIQIALRQIGEWCRFQCILHARVPILKFESSLRGISCDLSIDNLQGQIKSKFLLWISAIDARYRDMVLLVKEWAKAHDINDPKVGTFNSYSLSLLVIFHFQTCVPAILPPLKDIYAGNVAYDLQGARSDVDRHIAETCAAGIARFRQQRPVNRSSLSELFISFLEKFSDISLRASWLIIRPYTGQWEYAGTNRGWLGNRYAVFIEDPFEQLENSARAVRKKNLTRISEAFQMTHRRLISANQSRDSLIGVLVEPRVSQYITRAPAWNPTHRGGRSNSRPTSSGSQYNSQPTPPLVRTVPSIDRQLQNLSLGSRSNNSTRQIRSNNSTRQNSNQGQYIWMGKRYDL